MGQWRGWRRWCWFVSQVILDSPHLSAVDGVPREPGNESSIGLAASLSPRLDGNLTYAANTVRGGGGEGVLEDTRRTVKEKRLRLGEHKRVIAFPFFVLAGLLSPARRKRIYWLPFRGSQNDINGPI